MRSIASVLFLFVAACGDDGPTGDLADAPRPDDAPVTPDSNIDAPTAPVKMTVVDNEGPVEGLKVVFQNADGSLVSTQTTNASGEASAVMEAGGSVTVIDAFPTHYRYGGIAYG